MILIYTDTITSRIRYIFQYLLTSLYSIPVSFTADKEEFDNYKNAKLVYSAKQSIQSELQWQAVSLLTEEDILDHQPSLQKTDTGHVLFLLNPGSQHDPFAGAFFLLTRYEEYLPFEKDRFDRFEAACSFLYPDYLELPLVNIWAEEMLSAIRIKFPLLQFTRNKFHSVVTVDIDQAYAVQHKEWYRQGAILLRGIRPSAPIKTMSALAILSGNQQDPFDTFRFIEEEAFKSNIPFVFFINVGSRTDFDKNLPATSPHLKDLVKGLARWSAVGVHPSYYVLDNPGLLETELSILAEITGKRISRSRQHYIRLRMPDTYQQLLQNGIRHDYSMGFASYPGFRAGACTPFCWFNLTANTETELELFPFTLMEGTFAEDLGQSPEEAWDHILSLINTVKKYNGIFIPIWHNHSLSDSGLWKGWKAIFQRMIKHIQ